MHPPQTTISTLNLSFSSPALSTVATSLTDFALALSSPLLRDPTLAENFEARTVSVR